MRHFLRELFQTGVGRRTTVMRDLNWLLATCISGFLLSPVVGLPGWTVLLFAIMIVLIVVFYLGAYTYFARADPSALRSESYGLERYRLEHEIMGDSGYGLVEDNKDIGALSELVVGDQGSLPSGDQ